MNSRRKFQLIGAPCISIVVAFVLAEGLCTLPFYPMLSVGPNLNSFRPLPGKLFSNINAIAVNSNLGRVKGTGHCFGNHVICMIVQGY